MLKPKIACLGPSGSFSEDTLVQTLDHQPLEIHFVRDLRDLFLELDHHSCDYIWLPWWNSGCGFLENSLGEEFIVTIAQANNPYRIIADNFTSLKFSLLGLPGAALKDIETVYVNPYTQCLCKRFFNDHPHLHTIVKNSSSEAARAVAAAKDPHIAASANVQAAKLYDLEVLKETMLAPEEHALMQFILLARTETPLMLSLNNTHLMTSCIIRNTPPQEALADHGITVHSFKTSNLDPSIHLLDFDGRVEAETLKKILGNQCLRYLGCYPRTGQQDI